MISDLLKPERTNLVIREDKKKGVFVEGLSEWVVRSPQEIYGLMERGGLMRATGSTKMNELSSRSHAVFIIIAEQSETTYVDESGRTIEAEAFHQLLNSTKSSTELSKVCLLLHKIQSMFSLCSVYVQSMFSVKSFALTLTFYYYSSLSKLEANVRQSFKVGKLNLVDLAGSERVRLTGATGQRLEESKKINQVRGVCGVRVKGYTGQGPRVNTRPHTRPHTRGANVGEGMEDRVPT